MSLARQICSILGVEHVWVDFFHQPRYYEANDQKEKTIEKKIGQESN